MTATAVQRRRHRETASGGLLFAAPSLRIRLGQDQQPKAARHGTGEGIGLLTLRFRLPRARRLTTDFLFQRLARLASCSPELEPIIAFSADHLARDEVV
jgi:hypothetical protein